MLDSQFIGTNVHFAINLLAALVSFGAFWLIFDAWMIRPERREVFKWAGFLLLAIGFLARAASFQLHAGGWIGQVETVANLFRFLGYMSVIMGQFLDPLQKIPETHFQKPLATDPAKPASRHHGFALGSFAAPALPLMAFLAGALYLRRATTGLERHLKPVAWAFGLLAVFELLALAAGLTTTTNPNLYRLVEPLGPVWWAALVVLLLAALVLGRWVWHYLVERLQSQLFIILVTQTLGLFLISTVGFTFLLLQNIQKQSLGDLATASHVLDYAISSRQAETAAQAEAAATNGSVITAVAARDHGALNATLGGYMKKHNLTSLTVTDAGSAVLLRAEDPDRWGDSRSSDPLVRRALVGEASSSVVVREGVVAPAVSLVAGAPIRDGAGNIIGTVIAGRAISNAFVDGIRSSTGLDSAVYGGDVRAATTLTAQGGTDRAIGIKETTPAVTDQVLTKGQSYSGVVLLQNRPYLAAFTPLRNVNNVTVGMLLVAHPQAELYATANRSVELTFIFVAVLIIMSIYPVYLISRFLSRQLH